MVHDITICTRSLLGRNAVLPLLLCCELDTIRGGFSVGILNGQEGTSIKLDSSPRRYSFDICTSFDVQLRRRSQLNL
jgi:hypothetical protein